MDSLKELGVLSHVTEFIEDRLYFATASTSVKLKSASNIHLFNFDDQYIYRNFYSDFGPLNLAMVYRYCHKINRKLKAPALSKKILVHYTTDDPEKRANAAFLVGCFAIEYLNKSPEDVLKILEQGNHKPYLPFRDASFGFVCHTISHLSCFKALQKAIKFNFFKMEDFDVKEYEYYERVETGDFNWIVPGKFLAFCGPHSVQKEEEGQHTPESYFSYFRKHNVTTIIRLNKRIYEASRFTQAGFIHRDLIYTDGSIPSDAIVDIFLSACESSPGAVAVHCKAGLGRTGTLISCYLMKHFKFTAHEAIAWLRVCRPGSVIGHQQTWLEEKQLQLWLAGDSYLDTHKDRPLGVRCRFPVYSRLENEAKGNGNVSSVLGILGNFKLEDCTVEEANNQENAMEEDSGDKIPNEEEIIRNGLSQGDRLNQIKAMRKHLRANTTCPLSVEDTTRSRSRTSQKAAVFPKFSVIGSPLKSNRVSTTLASNHLLQTSSTSDKFTNKSSSLMSNLSKRRL